MHNTHLRRRMENRLRARDFIDWEALRNAEVKTHPYTYCEVDLIKPEFCELIYEEIKPGFYDAFEPGVNDRDGAFPVFATGDMNSSYAGDMQDALNTWDDWNDWFIEKFDKDLGLSHETWPRFGYQGANPNSNFEPHTDEIGITEVWAKGLIYLHNSVGTKMYESELITHRDFVDPDGNTVSNPVPEPYYQETVEYKESNGIGKLFLFKCNERSFHGTDFSSLTQESKRFILAGTFK